MANPSVVSLQLIAAVSNGIAQSQKPTGAGALTLNGTLVTAGVATMDVARRILVSSTGSDAAVIFTVTGTNQSGALISSTVTGVTSVNPVYTALDFLTVTSVTASAGTAGNITVGTNGVASTPWVLDNFLAPNWALAVAVSIASGTATYTVEHTYDDPNAVAQGGVTPAPAQFSLEANSYVPPLAWPNTTLQNMTVNGEAVYLGMPVFAHRLTVTTGLGKVIMQSIQSGIGDP